MGDDCGGCGVFAVISSVLENCAADVCRVVRGFRSLYGVLSFDRCM